MRNIKLGREALGRWVADLIRSRTVIGVRARGD